MGILDRLKVPAFLEAAMSDIGSSMKAALPKSPVPLSVAGLSEKASATFDSTVEKAKFEGAGKVDDLQRATVGKVTGAVTDRADSEVRRVTTAANTAVDGKINAIGSTVDSGITSANKSLDKALGRPVAKTDDETKDETEDGPETATAAKPEAKDDATTAAPLAGGWQKGSPTTRARSNAVVLGAGRARSNAVVAADEPAAATADEEKAAPAAVEPAYDENSDEAVAADTDVDLEGDAAAAAAERMARAKQSETPDVEEDVQEDIDEDKLVDELEANDDGPDAPAAGEAEPAGLEPEAEIEQIAADHAEADGLKAKIRAVKEKLEAIDNEAKALLKESVAASSNDPWLAFFAASAKFKKKKAIRDFRNDLEGKKEDEQEKKDREELKGAAKLQSQEITVSSGRLFRSQTSPDMAGSAVDTTGKKTGDNDGRQVFAVNKEHQLYMPYEQKDGDAEILSDSNTLVGGEVRVSKGTITHLSNNVSGEQESRADLLDFLQTLRDSGVGKFEVYEASKKDETDSDTLLDEADKADDGAELEPQPEQVKLLDVMAKSDEWKALIADQSEKLVLATAEQEGWKVAGDAVVDATGQPVDVALARSVVEKSRSKLLAEEAAATVARRQAGRPTVDA